jgi:hypothetical protein
VKVKPSSSSILAASGSRAAVAAAEQGPAGQHVAFAQVVDGRVGHLGEALAQEMADRADGQPEHGRGGVVAHRGRRLLAGRGHRPEHGGEQLPGEAEGGLGGDGAAVVGGHPDRAAGLHAPQVLGHPGAQAGWRPARP